MADATSPTKSIWMASGITLAVVVTLAAIFVGPKVVECTSATTGFASCARQALVDGGILPPAANTPKEVAALSPDNAATQSDTNVVSETEAPDFDVRVETDGSFVVAGSAPGNEHVEIYLNDILIGNENTVGAAGDWVFVPQSKLAVGGNEIRVILPDENKTLDKSYVVLIDSNPEMAPVVVAALPGEASQIIQKALSQVAAAPEQVIAVAEQAVTAVAPSVVETAEAVTSVAQNAAAPVVGADEQVASAASDAINTAVTGSNDTQMALLSAPPPVESIVASGKEAGVDAVVQTADAAKAALDTAAKTVAALTPSIAPTIDAIEIDGTRNYIAGSGQEGATIRLYVDNTFVGDTVVKNDRWLFDVEAVLANRSQRIRVDQLAENAVDVAARAEVDFIFEAPAEETAVASAQATTTEPQIVVPTPDFSIDTEVPAIIALGDTAAQTGETAVLSEQAIVVGENINPATAPVQNNAADAAAAANTISVAQTAAPAAEAEVPQLVASAIGDPDDQRFASGKAIIRQGDNLWTIARRVYGSGPRYTIIYQANQEQIRNPGLIYPGQVFVLPSEAAETNGN